MPADFIALTTHSALCRHCSALVGRVNIPTKCISIYTHTDNDSTIMSYTGRDPAPEIWLSNQCQCQRNIYTEHNRKASSALCMLVDWGTQVITSDQKLSKECVGSPRLSGSKFQIIRPATEMERWSNIELQWRCMNSRWQLADAV